MPVHSLRSALETKSTLWKLRGERSLLRILRPRHSYVPVQHRGSEDAKGLHHKNQRIGSSAISAPLRPLRFFKGRPSFWQRFS
jgi:hypothetical protein